MHYDKAMTTTEKRTDAHAPASDDFDPQAYEIEAFGDRGGNNKEEEPSDMRAAQVAVQALLKDGYKAGGRRYGSGQCGHCGAHLRYFALLSRADIKEFIYVGETCLDNRFDLAKEEFQKLRKAASLHRERATKKARIAALLNEFPFLAELLEAAKAEDLGEFLDSIATNLQANGELSDRQLDAAERAFEGHKKYVAKIAASEALKQAQIKSGAMKPAPTGRQIIQGTVLSLKDVEDNYSYFGGTIRKALVETTDLFKVWMTVPASISDIETGEKIQVTITLKPHDADKFFAIGTRPAKATKIS